MMGLFRKKLKQEHKIIEQHDRAGGQLQTEYHRATPECPHPELWSMYDSMSAEFEVLELIFALVTATKPQLIVETGSFIGVSTEWIARALARNAASAEQVGLPAGKIISCEYDPIVFARAQERFKGNPLSRFVDLRNASSLEMPVDGRIDMLFSDSDPDLREAEVRRFLPQMNPNGLILIHDASSHLGTVREAAKKLEREGLISILMLPTPRGLVLAQPRAALA
jgi:predicted O-methyltransferase YrrM